MKRTIVRYKTKPETAQENERQSPQLRTPPSRLTFF